jgi:hypothetical protein
VNSHHDWPRSCTSWLLRLSNNGGSIYMTTSASRDDRFGYQSVIRKVVHTVYVQWVWDDEGWDLMSNSRRQGSGTSLISIWREATASAA